MNQLFLLENVAIVPSSGIFLRQQRLHAHVSSLVNNCCTMLADFLL